MIISFCVFILTQATALFWYRDGFDLMEVAMLSVLAGVFYLLVLIFVLILRLNKYNLKENSNNKKQKKVIQIFIILLASFFLYLIIDSIFFLFDDSIQSAYAEQLIDMLKRKENFNSNELNYFSKMPFALQNGITTFIFGFIGSLISLIFVKSQYQQNN